MKDSSSSYVTSEDKDHLTFESAYFDWQVSLAVSLEMAEQLFTGKIIIVPKNVDGVVVLE